MIQRQVLPGQDQWPFQEEAVVAELRVGWPPALTTHPPPTPVAPGDPEPSHRHPAIKPPDDTDTDPPPAAPRPHAGHTFLPLLFRLPLPPPSRLLLMLHFPLPQPTEDLPTTPFPAPILPPPPPTGALLPRRPGDTLSPFAVMGIFFPPRCSATAMSPHSSAGGARRPIWSGGWECARTKKMLYN